MATTKFKTKNTKTGITRVAIVIDESGSMGHIQREVVDSFNKQLKEIQENSKKNNQNTFLSLYTFANSTKEHISGAPVDNILPWDSNNYCPNGLTALVEGTGRAARDLNRLYADAYLVLVITDGGENNSSYSDKHLVPQELRDLNATDKWTFVFIGPPNSRKTLESYFGALPGNVMEWEGTRQGVENYTVATRSAIGNYYAARAQNVTSTKAFFTPDLGKVSVTKVKKALDDLTPDFKEVKVVKESDIKTLVEEKMKSYVLGTAFYELTKKEKVQPQKDLLLMERKTGKIFGNGVRDFLNMPTGVLTIVDPGNHGDYRVFVQSTSTNRKLVRGTSVLVRK